MNVTIKPYYAAPNLWAVYLDDKVIYGNIYKIECELYAKEHGYNIINKNN